MNYCIVRYDLRMSWGLSVPFSAIKKLFIIIIRPFLSPFALIGTLTPATAVAHLDGEHPTNLSGVLAASTGNNVEPNSRGRPPTRVTSAGLARRRPSPRRRRQTQLYVISHPVPGLMVDRRRLSSVARPVPDVRRHVERYVVPHFQPHLLLWVRC